SNKGSVFITVTTILSILLILMGMLMTISTTDMSISQNYSDGIKAYYMAQSGVELAMAAALSKYASNSTTPASGSYIQSEYSFAITKNVSWTLNWDIPSNKWKVTSTANYGNNRVSVRIINVTLSIIRGKIVINSWQQIK
ncbi:MAG: pilus assembly PilX N-terminal domain-containing protein, partial [bacterium]|nr:pilus assembly PilX N-terminal domain-containing protein [bacterium]